jgi:hypothetical protein
VGLYIHVGGLERLAGLEALDEPEEADAADEDDEAGHELPEEEEEDCGVPSPFFVA